MTEITPREGVLAGIVVLILLALAVILSGNTATRYEEKCERAGGKTFTDYRNGEFCLPRSILIDPK